MSDTPTTPEAPQAPSGIEALIAHDEAREAARLQAQLDAEQAAEAAVAETQKSTAAAERKAYLKATEPTRNAPGYVERVQAYDPVLLRFIPGTESDSAEGARKAAKAAGHDGAVETRPI